jgi:hypothetical protein
MVLHAERGETESSVRSEISAKPWPSDGHSDIACRVVTSRSGLPINASYKIDGAAQRGKGPHSRHRHGDQLGERSRSRATVI